MYKVSKTISFAYSHRLLDYNGKCKNLHGHNALVELILETKMLNRAAMVADFTEFGGALKSWVDANLDHKVILCARDPLLNILKKARQACFAMGANPTAEALAELIFIQMKKLGLPVSEVKFWETDNSMASYKG
ncbi:MAG TPA: 6-pyruvoyl tetrahydrobiopterin synthase [Elusimicrobia bacterium]|nr:6-pyruvoyl tetrahydrobiopterin synthase [Elusimicrobiota bacterium]